MDALRMHVEELCRRHNVVIQVVDGMDFNRARSLQHEQAGRIIRRTIIIAPVVNDVTYAVALHELGHCVHEKGLDLTNRLRENHDISVRVDEERAAWEWAQAQALLWTGEMESIRISAYNSYVDELKAKYMPRRPKAALVDLLRSLK